MQLVDRVLKALEILSREANGMSVSELADALEIPASSAHRVLKSLQDNHFVMQDPDTKKYYIGYKVYSLCSGMREQNALIAATRPHMKELSQKLNMTVVLCVYSEEQIINLDCIENRNASVYMVKIGQALPLYSTSAGRVFAAYMNPEYAEDIFRRTALRQETPYTKTNPDDLVAELKKIRTQGYAVIDEELQIGVQGISCPITDGGGQVIAALALTMIKAEHSVNDEVIGELKRCAARITEEIS